MGLFSRQKGAREERALVNHLKKLGYSAERILRQYQAKNLPDVIARKDDRKITLELKTRNNSFSKIYQLYETRKNLYPTLRVRLKDTIFCMSIGTDLEEVKRDNTFFFHEYVFIFDQKELKVLNRLNTTVKDLKGDADILVLRDNNKPFLFIKYF